MDGMWRQLQVVTYALLLASCSGEHGSQSELRETRADFSQADSPALNVRFALFNAAAAQPDSQKDADDAAAADTLSEDEVNNIIDKVLGDHATYRTVFDDLQAAVAAEDAAAVANLVRFPIGVSIDGHDRVIKNAQEFVKNYQRFMTPEIVEAIKATSYTAVMVNAQGVMLGNGEVWISGICKDDACEAVDVKVVTVQSGPDQ